MEKVYTEKELILPALICMEEEGGLTTTKLISCLTKKLKPCGKDLDVLKGRNDTVFSQKVRNLISHKTIEKYFVLIENEMHINDLGIDYIIEHSDNDFVMQKEDEYSANLEINDDFRDENVGSNLADQTIQVDNIYLSVSDLKRKYDRMKNGICENSLKLDEDFQRAGGIWSRKNKSLFIESVILNIPIPSIYLSENSVGTFIVIDGRQRLSTLFDFIDDKFRLDGLTIMKQLNGKKFSQLTKEFGSCSLKIEDRSLHIAKIRYGTPETFIIETFERVNTKGARLNAQEIRNAINQGESTKLLNEISDCYVGENQIYDKKRMKDKYMILRYFAMKLYYDKLVLYKNVEFKSITDYLSNVMKLINKSNVEIIENYKNDFTNAYNRAISIFSKSKAFRISEKTPINMILFELTLIITSCLKNSDDNTIRKAYDLLINKNLNENANEETDFEKNIKYHRDSKENIEERLLWLKNIVEKCQ